MSKSVTATATETYLKGLGVSERPLVIFIKSSSGELLKVRVYRKTITM